MRAVGNQLSDARHPSSKAPRKQHDVHSFREVLKRSHIYRLHVYDDTFRFCFKGP